MLRPFFISLLIGCIAHCQSASPQAIEARRARLAAHASLPYLSNGGASLRERARTSISGTVLDVVHFDLASGLRPYPTTLDESIASKKCDADFVIHGVIVSGLSSLTTDEKAVFTDYEVDVKDTLYIKPGHQPRLPVVILKPGGAMKLPEGLVATVYDQYSDLHLRHEYILFLRGPKNPTDAYLLDETQTPGVLEIGPTSISFSLANARQRRTPPDWLEQASLEAFIQSSAWSSDAPQWCANRVVKSQ